LLLLAALVLQAKVMLVEHHLGIMVLEVAALGRLVQMLQAQQLLVVLDLHLLLLALAHITLEAAEVAVAEVEGVVARCPTMVGNTDLIRESRPRIDPSNRYRIKKNSPMTWS